MKHIKALAVFGLGFLAVAAIGMNTNARAAQSVDYFAVPPFLTSQSAPLVMLVMGKDHKLYYEAYNDASDINQDGTLDVGYKGEDEPLVDTNGNGVWDAGETFDDYNQDGKWTTGIEYYGYFDSYKCYEAVNTGADVANYGEAIKTRYDIFEPRSAPTSAGKPIKKCTGANDGYWSGDYLNYLTTSRMDAMRKVLYGGYRSVDTDTDTVLQRVYVPHDAHTWGKEYKNANRPNEPVEADRGDGYDIRDYTPLLLPITGTRHLFASTTKSTSLDPLLRVLPDSASRVWSWVAKERPLADQSLETAGGGFYVGHPSNHNVFNDMIAQFENAGHLYGTRNVGTDATYNGRIENGNSNVNPYQANPDEHYMTVFKGTITPPSSGNYEFAVNGDDAVEVIIGGNVQAGWYGGHGKCTDFAGTCETDHQSSAIPMTLGTTYTIEFRHEENGGDDNFYLKWRKTGAGGFAWQYVPSTAFSPDGASASTLQQSFYNLNLPGPSIITDYEVKVKVCDSAFPEKNCKKYPSGGLKPTGLLQKYGEDDTMFFGLMSGSYANNMAGGVLRKNISSIQDEINPTTGRFDTATNNNGIIGTINKFKIYGFVYAPTINNEYRNEVGGSAWVTTRPMINHEFPDWGNPIGEIMYESIRYFSGRNAPTGDYDYTNVGSIDNSLGLAKPAWSRLYTDEGGPFERCSTPFMLVISDINPSFDSDQLPGSYFNPGFGGGEFSTGTANIDVMNVAALAKKISDTEGAAGEHYIGQKAAVEDSSCSPKTVTDLGEIRGLCPEEPTKRGSYYSAAVAYYGAKYDINPVATGAQRVSTFAVSLASPLPRIEIPVSGKTITLVPFAKSVGGAGIDRFAAFQPTNTIVEFFVEKITPTYGKFRINFEDVEQGADHDMDAICMYEYQVVGDEVTITLTSTSAAGGIIQHMGYIISGVDDTLVGYGKNGTYLEVRDFDTAAGSDLDYRLDTPPGVLPGGAWADSAALPLTASRIFKPGTIAGATLLKDPLWYAAKWGGMEDKDTPDEDINNNGLLDAGEDKNGNGKIDFMSSTGTPLDPIPNLTTEWDNDGNDTPDSYFYVANPLKLEEQLTKSFAEMLRRASSGTSASVISSTRSGEGAVYQSIFFPEFQDTVGKAVQWVGEVKAMLVDDFGNMRTDMYWDPIASSQIPDTASGFGLHQLNIVNEDLNNNGILDTCFNEDMIIVNGLLDAGEDINHNHILDSCVNEDLDGDGNLDYRDLIVTYDGGNVLLWDDSNENGVRDIEDEIKFSPDILAWHNNGTLDREDLDGDGNIDTGEDINGNGILDSEDLNGNGTLDTELVRSGLTTDDINYLWRSQDWLDNNSLDPVVQRASYTDTTAARYIFTFVDKNNDMLVGAGEQLPFVNTGLPSLADVYNDSKIYPYLTLYPSYTDKPAWVTTIEAAGNKDVFLRNQSQRVVDFIRGKDQGTMAVGAATVPAMRSRLYRNNTTGVDQTWRLGDVVSSSPTQVGRPSEGYHLLYRDESYGTFLARYLKRRSVIYVGGNDGMFHAFNAGFFDSDSKSFEAAIAEPFTDANGNNAYDMGERFSDWNRDGIRTSANQTPFELGAEMWGYVPYNLLPHLYWLTEPTYPHVFYNDLAPKVFDARIFTPEAVCGANPFDPDCIHPEGWGTVMVFGMRFGGGHITADMNKNNVVDVAAGDREMSSAYVVMDITNPEQPPTVLAEIRLPQLGYTTCYPTVIPMRSKTGFGAHINFATNDWYLVFGSGPADANGYAASRDIAGQVAVSGTVGASDVLDQGISLQNGKLFVVDLMKLTSGTPSVVTVNADGQKRDVQDVLATNKFIEEFDDAEGDATDDVPSMISQPVTVDYDLDFNADAVYFGTIAGTGDWASAANKLTSFGGRLKRLIINDEVDTTQWVQSKMFAGGIIVDRADNTLLNLMPTLASPGKPITAAPTASVGETVSWNIDGNLVLDGFDRERWLLFGTGRYIVSADAVNADQQSYYGIKEPYVLPGGSFTWGEVSTASLLNSTNVTVRDDKTVNNLLLSGVPITTWDAMIAAMNANNWPGGWVVDFDGARERNLGQAALLGGLLTFTTYLPSSDICLSEGRSSVHARWYQTGTTLFQSVFQDNIISETVVDGIIKKGETINRAYKDLGIGMALTPSIHTGREEGSKVYIQTSTGDIITLDQGDTGASKSRKTDWLQRR